MTEHNRERHFRGRALQNMPTRALLRDALKLASRLVKKEIELAKAEARSDVKRELAMVRGLGIAAVCLMTGVNLVMMALAFVLAIWVPGWLAAAALAVVVLAIGTVFGVVGWSKRVRIPLKKTRKTLKEDLRWVKERMA